MTDLIKQAREMFKKGCPLDGVTLEQSLAWTMIPTLADALETMTARAEKAEKERDAAVKDLYAACKGSPCNNGICVKKNCIGNKIPCEFEWRGAQEEG